MAHGSAATASLGAPAGDASSDHDACSPAPPPVEPILRFDVLGVRVSAVSMTQAVAAITRWIAAHRRGEPTAARYVCVSDVHAVLECRHDPALRDVHNAAAMVTPDGMPLVWLGRLFGYRHVTRVYGPDLLIELCGGSKAHGLKHFFYGGGEGVAERLARRLGDRFPGLIVAGTYTPPYRPLSPDERATIIATIEAARPDIVWVGLGAPKQERWMAEFARRASCSGADRGRRRI